ncbi:hypothetical protein AK812_SmicGene12132 [Symbiodinium microadriaticum]|uniref:Uncharacterized protein n=2 Tax=Symbiodinium TaxID=2949 RepID=A0A1Q9EBE6_SYMMI|nr:hypothetical protein AK812_SmicGene12132 [Symbiodinium microadriaticum]
MNFTHLRRFGLVPVFNSTSIWIWPGELSSSLWKKGFGVKVSGQVPFESCEDFLLCAAPMFIPCVLWSLEADVHFEEQFAPKLLQSPNVRCFALRLATPPKFEGPPVLGMDMWFAARVT